MVSSIIEKSPVKSTWFCSLLSFLFDRYCCIRSLINVNLYGSEQYSWFKLSPCTLFDYDSCLCDITWCRDQDGGNSTETNLFSCGLSSSFNKDPKRGKESHGEGTNHRNGYPIAKQHRWAPCAKEIFSTGTWREDRSTPWRTDDDEIQDEILELSSQRSRFIHLTLSDKKSTQPPSPATHQEFPQSGWAMNPLSCKVTLQILALQELKKCPHSLIKQPRREPHTHKRRKAAVHSNTGEYRSLVT